ncbi:MAG: D-glycero-beta-D-manno-heptose 1-phosphate adenylyltransferase [Endomicrobiia bacterium]|nr:D-glycero-beta-D-manno-heptose 1-phosphate adenylyltransferase [Endomicrobiaceae bacterium]MDD3053421.1 D-glycero-beta-D-manno-heptose 1-phosphate adenylyltransferase [Endomicrobiaceae bacterium]MDD3922578.1 D-glycero-beta-D-manno-heptose 1-phosphate adenylyltransferase [Endomicrobiaceae bacterium]MDD5101563.1 D-glycero-beta-D-manno-heptose 1-phosphate adenylyltransferase [Endomicrobiaceae bacterium]
MDNKKICSIKQLVEIIKHLKAKKKKIVFTNGCFDLIHIGHVSLFQKAKTLGDVLIVAINSDKSLANLKGPKRPLVPQKDRTKLLAAITAIDYVVVFNEQTPFELLSKLKPDVLVKGGDYKIEDIVGREFVKKVYRYPLVEGKSTSNLIKLIVERYS